MLNSAFKNTGNIIPVKKLIIDTCRNKKNSKVSVSFHPATADWLTEETREKFASIHKARINNQGLFTIRSDKTRSQTLNVADCMDKLRCYISEAQQPPPQELFLETIELSRQRLERAAMSRLKVHNKI